jgi:hypothetical protein
MYASLLLLLLFKNERAEQVQKKILVLKQNFCNKLSETEIEM